jgi:putative transcriptional regulator
MPRKTADPLLRGLNQAFAAAQSVAEASICTVQIPDEIDVRAIRVRLGLTQQQFAVRFGFSVNTLRHWEQGRRVPEAPTRAYLLVIDRQPQAVERALRIP